MGRPLSKQQLFGANAKNNIKVQFHNGTASVRGYIVEQTGSKRFKCIDENGVTAVCYLKDKASADLQAGEMSISFKYDDGTVQQATKISRHRITVDYNGSKSFPWNFSTSTTDGAWQVEEAGTDSAMTSATDLEGDDIYIPAGMDRNAPLPGSGTWNTAAQAGVPSYALRGSLQTITGGVTTVPGTPATGLYRRKYVGYPFTGAAATGSYDATFFTNPSHGPISTPDHEVDTYVSFGQRNDLPAEDGYSFEWKGYIKVPVSGNYNTFISCDDDVAFWIGSDALNPTGSNVFHKQTYVNANAAGGCTNSVTLDSTKWYPVRIWFVEFGGAERFQFFMNNSTNSTKYGYDGTSSALQWSYNANTKGY